MAPTTAPKTCGALFQQCIDHLLPIPMTPLQLFAAGMVYGQAEKVYLGACQASMFRPSAEHRAWHLELTRYICDLMDLRLVTALRFEISDEIWICRPGAERILRECLERDEVNSPAWHTFRGLMTGVPMDEVDMEFHRRRGFGLPCDRVTRT